MSAPEEDPKKELKISGYILAGLAMMLNIRLSYSSAPYALIRFRLHENLFSVFVRRMASALELWCLPSMLLGNIMDYGLKGYYKDNGYQQDFGNAGNLKVSGGYFKPRQEKFFWIIIPSIICQWLNFLTYVILLVVYVIGGDQGHLTVFYFVIAISGVVFGINMVLVYAADWNYTPVYMVGENSFPIVTSFMHYITTLIFGNRRKWNSDFLIACIDIGVAIIISFVASVLWTVAYGIYSESGSVSIYTSSSSTCNYNTARLHNFSPVLMILVGMGLVYMIYPAIAPGMIVPFYLIDKIEMILLIATAVPPVIVATLKHHKLGPYVWMGNWGGDHTDSGSDCTIGEQQYKWQSNTSGMAAWHLCDVFAILMITLAYIFVYSLHYKESKISRAIINQPKMSTFLTIVFYMSHECLLDQM